MGVLLPNYPEENVVKGETGMLSNVFQILQDLRFKQCQETNSDSSRSRASQTSTTDMTCTTTQLTPLMTYGSTPANRNTGMATPITSMSELSTASRTTMPANTTPSSRQPTSEIHQNTSRNGLPQYYVHVQQPTGLQARRTASLEESQDSTQWQDFCEQIPIGKAGHIITIFQLL